MRVGGRGRRRRRHRTLDTIFEHGVGNDHGTKIKARKVGSPISGGVTMKSGKNSRSKCWTIIASSALFAFMVPVTSSMMLPAWGTQLSSAGMGRNIRHLPCVSRRTGETGLCMFAYSCAKANGTHLGTCIDRFYFGSCCKIASGTDIDLVEPIAHNHLSNKDDATSTTVRTTYQKPSPTRPSLPNFSNDGSSTVPISVSTPSTMSRPLSVLSSSTTGDTSYSSTFMKTSSSKPPAAVHTVSYDSFPTSRTPLVNVTFSQSYSSPASHVTTSPLVYSTTVTTTFQTGTHKPALPAVSTTAYSKPITKPTSSKPSPKPKPPSQNTGKPGPTKPKPTPKPSTNSTPPHPAVYTPSASPTISSFFNKTTVHSAFTNNGLSSKPSVLVTEPSVPSKPYPSSTPSASPSFSQFSSNKKPAKPVTRPTFTTPSTSSTSQSSSGYGSSNNYVKIPVSTVPAQNKLTTISSLSSHMQTVHTIHTTPTYSTTPTSSTEDNFLRVNTSASDNEITEKPSSQFWTTTSEKLTTRPWSSSSISTTTITSHPSLVTWTTIEEVPAIILPDRTKPTSIIKPSGKPPTTKPTFLPTFSKPSTAFSKPSPSKPTKPITTKPDIEENYRPTIAMTSSTSTSTSSPSTAPSWVEVSVTTHAPSSSAQASSSPETSSVGTTGTFTYTPAKPSTTITIPVASPLPIDTTPAPIETNEIESASLNMSDYREICGRRLFPNARIVGGEKASFGEWPWQISLRQWRPSSSTYLHKCGAALFNENWAVTAAHCVEGVPPSDLLLRLGEYDLSTEDEPYGFQERRVQIVASHPQFDPRTFEYDLALLRFYEPVQFHPNIVPICVPDDDTNFVGSTAYVTGWGRLYDDGPLPNVLQEVSVPVINNSMCESMYQSAGYIEHIPNIFICAGWRKGGFDSCEGDSGGPMVIQRPDKRWLLAGIISWGIGCAEPNQPGVYTRISAFRDWINQILQF